MTIIFILIRLYYFSLRILYILFINFPVNKSGVLIIYLSKLIVLFAYIITIILRAIV